MSEDQIRTLLSFARKAGKLAAGRSAVSRELEKRQVHLLLIAGDASDKVDKLFHPGKGIKIFKFLDKRTMAEMLGRDEHVAIIAVCDVQFAQALEQLLPPENRITDL
ncbi:MAG TPA: ribosomal L7Ae/L30e/S12e/Gadd45 family protein [bacterium]|nr:ribosomal L7Ae/L30e/S12e/Gadd45 family protein [bacterium]HPN42434.1 ribosomal L7Ae/L30e/S12e/Gadd45 family protein [bacterium]